MLFAGVLELFSLVSYGGLMSQAKGVTVSKWLSSRAMTPSEGASLHSALTPHSK